MGAASSKLKVMSAVRRGVLRPLRFISRGTYALTRRLPPKSPPWPAQVIGMCSAFVPAPATRSWARLEAKGASPCRGPRPLQTSIWQRSNLSSRPPALCACLGAAPAAPSPRTMSSVATQRAAYHARLRSMQLLACGCAEGSCECASSARSGCGCAPGLCTHGKACGCAGPCSHSGKKGCGCAGPCAHSMLCGCVGQCAC